MLSQDQIHALKSLSFLCSVNGGSTLLMAHLEQIVSTLPAGLVTQQGKRYSITEAGEAARLPHPS